jgi:hypothetical protein
MSIYDSSFTNTSSAVSLSKAHVREPEKVRGKTMAARGRSMREGLAVQPFSLSTSFSTSSSKQVRQIKQAILQAGGTGRMQVRGGEEQTPKGEGSRKVARKAHNLWRQHCIN